MLTVIIAAILCTLVASVLIYIHKKERANRNQSKIADLKTEVLREGYLRKGGINPSTQIHVRPPPPSKIYYQHIEPTPAPIITSSSLDDFDSGVLAGTIIESLTSDDDDNVRTAPDNFQGGGGSFGGGGASADWSDSATSSNDTSSDSSSSYDSGASDSSSSDF